MTKKIEMSKTEAKAAGKINSEKFNELHTLRAMYPTFEIEIKVSAAKKKPDYKGLTYDYMKKYIAAHDDEQKSIMAEFEMLRGTSEEANAMEMIAVSLQRLFSQSASGGVGQKDVKGFFKGDFLCFGTSCGHLNSCHGSDLLSHLNSDEKTGGHSFFRK